MNWFRNLRWGVPFSNDPANPTQSTDYSLQLADSIQNFRTWQASAKALSASEYHPTTRLQTSPPKALSPYKVRINGRDRYKIRRDQPQAE